MTNKRLFKRAHAKASQLMHLGCGCYAVAFKLGLKECYAELKAEWVKPKVELMAFCVMTCIGTLLSAHLSTINLIGAVVLIAFTVFVSGLFFAMYLSSRDVYRDAVESYMR